MKKIKILLLENDKADAKLIKASLREELEFEFEFVRVESRKDFIKQIKKYAPDVILSDYSLPQYNGLKALDDCKSIDPTLPFIIVTGSMSEEAAVDTIKAGAWDYVVKQNLSRLPVAFRNALQRKSDLLDRQRVESELRKSEERFRNLFDQAGDGISIHDLEGNILDVNQKLCEMFGYSKEEFTSRQVFDGHPSGSESEKIGKQAIQKIQKEGKIQFEAEFVTKSGEVLFGEVSSSIVEVKGTQIVRSVFRDITKRKIAEKRMARFERIFEESLSEIYIFKADTLKFIQINASAQNNLGYTIEELRKLTLLDLNSEFTPESFEKMIAPLRSGKKRKHIFETVLKRKNQSLYNVEVHLQLLRYDQEELFVAIISDITDRKRAEKELVLQAEILGQVSDAVVVINNDADYSVLYWNKGAEIMYGWSAGEVVHKPSSFLNTEFKEQEKDSALKAISKGGTFEGEVTQSKKDGKRFPVDARIISLRNDQGDIVGWIELNRDISSKKIAEDKLRESEERYRTLIDQIPAVVYNDDLRSDTPKTRYVSPYLKEMYGYTPREWIEGGYTLWKESIHPEDREKVQKVYQAATSSGGTYMSEHRMISKSGEIVWVRDQATVLSDENGVPETIHGVIHDITALKQAETAITYQVSELETLYENALKINGLKEPKAIAQKIVDVLEKKLDWHHVAIRLYDQDTDHIEVLALNNPGIPKDELRQEIDRLNNKIKTPDQGLSGWVIRHATPVRSGNLSEDLRYIDVYQGLKSGLYIPILVGEKVLGSIAVESKIEDAFTAHDERLLITLANQAAVSFDNALLYQQLEQRVAERTSQIQEAHRRIALATEVAQIGIWEQRNGDDNYYWDENMHSIYGTSPADFQATHSNWLEFIYPDDRQDVEEKRIEAIENGTPYKDEYRIVAADGTLKYIHSDAIAVYNEQRKFRHMVGVNMDITPIKQAEDTLRIANMELERALRVKDEFLANMSHELRTPLNAILGLSESLEEQIAGPLNEKQLKYIHTISESGHHLLALINDVLDLAKIEAGQITLEMNKVNIHLVCQASVRMIKQLAQKKGQKVSIEIDDDIELIWADERRLKQMIVNLLSNAVKFTPSSGKIGIKVESQPSSNSVQIAIWDTGIGIKEEELDLLFKPFVQLDSSLTRQSSGTGLGLALVAQMARLHGGRVEVESVVGQGSRFTIILPLRLAKKTGPLDSLKLLEYEGRKNSKNIEKKEILLVEDTKAVVMMLKDYLETANYSVTIANDGLDGVVMAQRTHPDLILMDVMMPGMDGLEATRKIKSDSDIADIPIVGLTAMAMESDRKSCLDAGMDDYLSKPVNLHELVSVIQKHLSPEVE